MNERTRVMCTFDAQYDQALDEIINARRTYRIFRPEAPPKEHVSAIIQAGLAAPFAAATAGGRGPEYIRQFFVFSRESRGLVIAGGLLMQKVHMMADELEKKMKHHPPLREKAGTFANRLAMIRNSGVVPGVETAPYYIVVAERKGFPPFEQQSLAHCLQNMWLKATVLNLGFQLVSVTGEMGSDPEFCRVLGVRPDIFGLSGCAIGYYQEQLPPSIRPPADQVTTWVE